ncbi:MAG: exodeoxyribonuclease V subunit alpha [Kiritimatiellia bacterium]
MTMGEARRRLALFEIPAGKGAEACEVRDVLARLMAAGSLALSDCQVLRDIAEETGEEGPHLYLLLAAMRLSQMAGNTLLRTGRGPEFLADGGHLEEPVDGELPNGAFETRVRALWTARVGPLADTVAQQDGSQLIKARELTGAERGWFFAQTLESVETVSEKLRELDARAAGDVQRALGAAELDAAVRFRGWNGTGFRLNAEQREAVDRVARRSFVVVTGGPGTGKTTVVCAILRALLQRGDLAGEEIALAAPTGRAAQRMAEALHRQCALAESLDARIGGQIQALSGMTIHALLGGLPPNWKYTAANRLPYRLVIIDEASMVDVNLMRALLVALADDCRLVLLGDKDQLPSVDAGAVLGDIVTGFNGKAIVRLERSNRFTESFAACAAAINAGDFDAFRASTKALPVPGEDWMATLAREDPENVNRVFRRELPEQEAPQRLLLEWSRHYGFLTDGELVRRAKAIRRDDPVFRDQTRSEAVARLFDQLDCSRILTVVREGPYGAKGINELTIKARYRGRVPANPLEKAGVPVLITRNTRQRNLWNGDIGVTVEGPTGMVALFPRGDAVGVCPVGLLPEHELAYAITVHKSQGSEFENVLVVLPPNADHPLLSRPLVYTGVTRAKRRAVVMGTRPVIQAALARAARRDSCL